jgi:hypothetical protein
MMQDTTKPQFTDALFGQWRLDTPVTKSLEMAEPSHLSRWQMQLPGDAHAAQAQLRQEHAQLEHDQRDLDLAIQRLAAFTDSWEPDQVAAVKSLELELETSPENKLAAVLATAGEPQAKGLLDPLQDAREEFGRFAQRVRELISNYAQIETTAANILIARTIVGWTGDFNTALADSATFEQIQLHRQNVHLALARRAMVMRLMVVVGASAAKIILRLATPGAQLLVIPAIWQFIRDVVQEIQTMHAQPSLNP